MGFIFCRGYVYILSLKCHVCPHIESHQQCLRSDRLLQWSTRDSMAETIQKCLHLVQGLQSLLCKTKIMNKRPQDQLKRNQIHPTNIITLLQKTQNCTQCLKREGGSSQLWRKSFKCKWKDKSALWSKFNSKRTYSLANTKRK